MTLPLERPLSIKDLETEFTAPPGTPLSEFLKGGTYVPDNTENVNVPTALPLALTDFYGAAATVPVVEYLPRDPAGNMALLEVPGPLVTEGHNFGSNIIDPDEEWVIDLQVRCNADHIDGDDVPPQLSGYSWARQRMRLFVGAYGPYQTLVNDFRGVALDFYFTSSTQGYVRCSTAMGRYAEGAPVDQAQLDAIWYDQTNTDYGNFVIPSDENAVRVRVTRGESLTQINQTGRWALDYRVYLYLRDEWVNVWSGIESRCYDPDYYGSAWNDGGTLCVGNNVYENNAECDLEFTAIAGAIGAFEIP